MLNALLRRNDRAQVDAMTALYLKIRRVTHRATSCGFSFDGVRSYQERRLGIIDNHRARHLTNRFYASGPREDPSEPPHALTTESSQTRRR